MVCSFVHVVMKEDGWFVARGGIWHVNKKDIINQRWEAGCLIYCADTGGSVDAFILSWLKSSQTNVL